MTKQHIETTANVLSSMVGDTKSIIAAHKGGRDC